MSRPRLAWSAVALALGAFVCWSFIADDELAVATRISFRVVALALLLAAAFALPAAMLLARWRSPLRPFVEAALLAPMVLPPTVTGFALASLLAPEGPLGVLGLPFTWHAASLAAAVVSYPLLLRAARTAIESVDSRYVVLARIFGRGRMGAFLAVTLPLAGPGMVAGAALTLGRALGEFGATRMVAGSIPGETRTLSLAVYDAWTAGEGGRAGAASAALIGLAVVLVGAAALLERRSSAGASTGAHVRGERTPMPAAAARSRVDEVQDAAVAATPRRGGDLRLEGVHAWRGSFAVGPLDLHIPAGAYGVLLGPSGAGKSTLLAALTGAIDASGRASLGGADLLGLPPERRSIGLVPQGGLLLPHLDVEANVAFGGADRAAVAAALDAVGADHLAGRMPAILSGGETMRVALARAIAARPALLLLDEPLAGLDPAAREALLPILASLPARLGGTPILEVTHDFDEAFRLGTRLAILLDGRIVAAGAPEEVFAAPPSAAVAAFLRIDNLLAGSFAPATGGLSRFHVGALELEVAGSFDGQGWLAIDGSSIVLCAPPPPIASARNAIVAAITRVERLPNGAVVALDCSGVELRARVTAAALDALAIREGMPIGVLLKATAPRVVPRAR